MPVIYEFTSYREYLAAWIKQQPKAGRGLKGQISEHLKVSSTMVSLVLSGQKTFSFEQGSDLADFLGLQERESDYFLLLLALDRAGSQRLKQKLERQIKRAQEQARKVGNRLKRDIELSDESKAIYYSSWLYTAMRNLMATEKYTDITQISERLKVPRSSVTEALGFLLEQGLVKEDNNRYLIGPTYTHVDSQSPFVNKHWQNWRLRGFTIMEQKAENDLFYTCPMSLSKADAERIRGYLLSAIQHILEIVRPSPSEQVACLNLDWFEY